jgi:flagellar biosynthesis protein FlhF
MEQVARDLAGLRLEMERLKASFPGAAAVVPHAPLEAIAFDSTLGVPGLECAVVALVGPPGAGKTTTLIKLAAHYGLAGRKRTQILTADVHRIGAADQLRALASILGIGCEVVETPLMLAQAIEEHRSKHLVLIDTPGLSACEMEDGATLAALLASLPEVDTHLVLPASMKPAAMARAADQYAAFQPKKLIFTRIDEAAMARAADQYAAFQPKKLIFTRIDEIDNFSDLAIEAARSRLPVSFFCGGQQIPDDIEPVTQTRWTELTSGANVTQDQNTLGATA